MKTLSKLLVAFLIVYAQNTFAQEIKWQNTIGGSGWDNLASIVQCPDGGFLIGGGSGSGISGDKTENTNGNWDIWIVKTDRFGMIQWQNTIGGDSADALNSINLTPDGGYILGCDSESGASFDKTETGQGEVDFWVIKIDSLGNIQWQNTIGGNKRDNNLHIISTSDGGYLVGGTSFSDSTGDKNEGCIGGLYADLWILKLDAFGNITWQNTIGGTGGDWLSSLIQCSGGGYMIGATSSSDISGDKTENSRGNNDYWVIRMDTSGNFLWQKTLGGSQTDNLSNFYETADGGFILGGDSRSDISGDKTEGCLGPRDFWIIKLDSVGNIQWQNTIGGNSVDMFHFINLASDGGYYLCGGTYSGLSGDKNEDCDDCFDFWVLKIDSTGQISWQNTIAGENTDYPNVILETNDGDVLVGGNSRSNISYDKTEQCIGGDDFWILNLTNKYNRITGSLFNDSNSNNIADSGEVLISNKIVSELATGRSGFSNSNGYYSISIMDTGLYSVYNSYNNYYNINPLIHSANFTAFLQIDSLNDFAFQAAGVYNDLCANINPIGNFRTGFDANYYLNYSNQGTTALSPTVIFYPDYDITFISASIAPAIVTSDSVVWYIGLLNPWEAGQILVTVNVNSGLPIGTLINSGVVIEPIAGDANTQCNQSFWEILTTGSYDPNDILVSQEVLTTNEVSQGTYLDYLIRFQNTGNDTAFSIKILNPIDTTKLELTAFEFLSSSHPINITWFPWERNMEFKFDNILLPDSNINETLSHGFVRYRIQPKNSLMAGDSITNFAAIYFDFNTPVITNSAITDIILPSSVNDYFGYNINVYPNPVVNEITLELKGIPGGKFNIDVYNVFGQKVKSLYGGIVNPENWERKFDVSDLSKGIYILTISGIKSIKQKIIKL